MSVSSGVQAVPKFPAWVMTITTGSHRELDVFSGNLSLKREIWF